MTSFHKITFSRLICPKLLNHYSIERNQNSYQHLVSHILHFISPALLFFIKSKLQFMFFCKRLFCCHPSTVLLLVLHFPLTKSIYLLTLSEHFILILLFPLVTNMVPESGDILNEASLKIVFSGQFHYYLYVPTQTILFDPAL